MNKIINRLAISLTFILILLTVFSLAIENNLMFVISGFLSLIFIIFSFILISIFFKNEKKINKKIIELKNKENKSSFELLYLIGLEHKEKDYFKDEVEFKCIDFNKINIIFYYKELEIKFIVIPNYIIFNGNKLMIMSLTLSDLINEINQKINDVKIAINNIEKNDKEKIENELLRRRKENLYSYDNLLNSNIFVSIFVIIFFLTLTIFLFLGNNSIFTFILISLFLFITLIFILNLIYVFKFKEIIKKTKIKSEIKSVQINSKKVKLICSKLSKNELKINLIKLVTNEGNFYIPVLENKIHLKDQKNIIKQIKKLNHSFNYYTNSNLVISNNNIYENIIKMN